MSLQDTYTLKKSSDYTNPREGAAVLPIVYGDLSENTPSDQGALTLNQIDTVNDVWAMAGTAIQAVADGNTITLFDDDGEISSSEYTVSTSGDYESQGTIAYVTFSTPPTGDVSAVFSGKAFSDGTLITNPADMVEDFIGVVNEQIDMPRFDNNLLSYAKGVAEDLGYVAAGAVTADQKVSFWLNTMLSSFLGSFWVTADQKLVIQFDADSILQIAGRLRDDRTVTKVTRKLANVCNQTSIRYAKTWATRDRRYAEGVRDAYFEIDDGETTKNEDSQDDYDVQLREFDFDFTRNTATVRAISSYLVSKFGGLHWIADKTNYDFHDIQVEHGDHVLYSCDFLEDENGLELRNQYAQVLNNSPAYDEQQQRLQLFDTGVFYPQTSGLWDGSASVGDGTWFNGDRDRELA